MSLLDYESHIDFTYRIGNIEFRTGYSVSNSLPHELFVRVNFPKELYPILLPKAVDLNYNNKEVKVYPDKEDTFLVRVALGEKSPLIEQIQKFSDLNEKLKNLIEIVIKELALSLDLKDKPVLISS